MQARMSAMGVVGVIEENEARIVKREVVTMTKTKQQQWLEAGKSMMMVSMTMVEQAHTTRRYNGGNEDSS